MLRRNGTSKAKSSQAQSALLGGPSSNFRQSAETVPRGRIALYRWFVRQSTTNHFPFHPSQRLSIRQKKTEGIDRPLNAYTGDSLRLITPLE